MRDNIFEKLFRFYGFILWVVFRVGKCGTKYLRIYSKMFGPIFTYSGILLWNRYKEALVADEEVPESKGLRNSKDFVAYGSGVEGWKQNTCTHVYHVYAFACIA